MKIYELLSGVRLQRDVQLAGQSGQDRRREFGLRSSAPHVVENLLRTAQGNAGDISLLQSCSTTCEAEP